MLSEPVVVRKGRGVRQQEATAHRAKTHRVVSQTATEQVSFFSLLLFQSFRGQH